MSDKTAPEIAGRTREGWERYLWTLYQDCGLGMPSRKEELTTLLDAAFRLEPRAWANTTDAERLRMALEENCE